MSLAKTIAVIGVSDEETAHLRLLMRKYAADFDHRWRWGDEKSADLLLVDPVSFAGQMARTRALSSGKRCVTFSEAAPPGDDLVLSRPLRIADVVRVLNRVAGADQAAMPIGVNGEDFYTRDLGDSAAAMRPSASPEESVRSAAGLDDLLEPTPLELREASQRAMPERQAATPAAVEKADPASVPNAFEMPGAMVARADAVPSRYATRATQLAATAPHPLRVWLQQDLLSAPARIALPGLAPLVLDPKRQVAHAAVGLCELEPYCEARWRLCDWQPLTTAELAHARATQQALSYARLIWMDVLVHSGGRLARHLDPAGTYRLTRWIEVESGFNRYFRIASATMQGARLHEIAAASGAPMANVFDFINACDAIGLIEWWPRVRGDDSRPSLLDKLRRPFG